MRGQGAHRPHTPQAPPVFHPEHLPPSSLSSFIHKNTNGPYTQGPQRVIQVATLGFPVFLEWR